MAQADSREAGKVIRAQRPPTTLPPERTLRRATGMLPRGKVTHAERAQPATLLNWGVVARGRL